MAFTRDASVNPSIPQSDTPYASPPSDVSNPLSPSNPLASPILQTTSITPLSQQEPPIRQTILERHPAQQYQPSHSSSFSLSSPVRRKPLPPTASPIATRFSSGEHLAGVLNLASPDFTKSFRRDQRTVYQFPRPPTSHRPLSPVDTYLDSAIAEEYLRESSPETSAEETPEPAFTSHEEEEREEEEEDEEDEERVEEEELDNKEKSFGHTSLSFPQTVPIIASPSKRNARLSDTGLSSASYSTEPWVDNHSNSNHSRSATMSMFSPQAPPPHITLPNNNVDTRNLDNTDNNNQKPSPRSPGGSKLSTFFGWGGQNSPASASSATSFSDSPYSPAPPSPLSPANSLSPAQSQHNYSYDSPTSPGRQHPTALDINKANAGTSNYFSDTHLQIPPITPASSIQLDEMEHELKAISTELASSIKREMDLEDLVERLQADAMNFQTPGKRTSDYYSDAGTSSFRYGESDSKTEELERLQRKTEQEKASIRLELTDKLQDERGRRKILEAQIRGLEEKASQVDLAQMNSLDASGRLKELEATCEDLRRRLSEERQLKDNFEDLLSALKADLQSSHNERDNLRDEIVPQLRARVEGLEAEAAEHEKLTYEQSRMQQELETLKSENATLISARKLQMDMQQQMNRFSRIVEETPPMTPRSSGLGRSNSVASRSVMGKSGTLSRSTSVKGALPKGIESRDALAERVKDIEMQRDALHRALKSLLERQEYQNKENEKRIAQLEAERDRALTSKPKRQGYDKDVAQIRDEINELRRRADEAIEQKWQCEKGLSGLKMDLDRAEQEIGSLRSLLAENDILIPAGINQTNGSRPGSIVVTSDSLERAYVNLQAAYSESLERIRNLELDNPTGEDTSRAIDALQSSLSIALKERDFHADEAASLRENRDSLQESVKESLGHESALAEELRESAQRVEQLATQVRDQLAANESLRQRLAETIERGEKEQKANAKRIYFMQGKLKSLEDQVMAAQQQSEESISKHEEDLSTLRETRPHGALHRVNENLRSPRSFTAKTPLSPLFANTSGVPRLDRTTSGGALSITQQSKVDILSKRVVELERALAEADEEMEEVVGKMNESQIEVMNLQNEREEAMRITRRLQKEVEAERLRGFEEKFASLSASS